MLSDLMIDQLNRQITNEFKSAYSYLSLCAFAELADFSGASGFFRQQFDEELVHAMKLFEYVVKRHGGKVKFASVTEPNVECGSLLQAFELALDDEQKTTQHIYRLLDLANEEKDYATIALLNTFAEEQAEEESTMQYLVNRLRLVGDDGPGLLLIDRELAGLAPALPGPEGE